MIHRHLNRPEFTFGKRTLRFKLKTRPWMLRLMRRAKFLRRLLPAWHAREKAFRAWYFDVTDQFEAPRNAEAYATWLKVLRLPEEVYRLPRGPLPENGTGQKTSGGNAGFASCQCGGKSQPVLSKQTSKDGL